MMMLASRSERSISIRIWIFSDFLFVRVCVGNLARENDGRASYLCCTNGSVRLSVQQQNLFFALVQREKRSASGTGRSSGASDPSDPSHHGSSSKNS